MVPIESLEQLRDEVSGLIELKFVQASGSIERRGIEVDHGLYRDQEGMTIASQPAAPVSRHTPASTAPSAPIGSADTGRLDALEQVCTELREQNRELVEDVRSLREKMQSMEDNLERLRGELGG